MTSKFSITQQNPHSIPAQTMIAALWKEIQQRYGFTGECDINPSDFTVVKALFLVAFVGDLPVGSIGLKPLSEEIAELDTLYVSPEFRKQGVARALLQKLEAHARLHRFRAIRLRAGGEQPEALRFYKKMGFVSIPCFGNYASSEANLCFEKRL
ncbi:GNAT family N-acetyltransferase [Pleurocapsales cyanobacterium LEGE 06147]|nr:GNAT family N-acetyltransferase [Pleurocapsales cyanobacterium LEGE 06147]